jgi:hypothetical protein
MNKLVGFTLTALSFSALAKLPDPLWTPQGGNYQQQFGSPISHEKPSHRAIANDGMQKPATSSAHVTPSSSTSVFPPAAHHLL